MDFFNSGLPIGRFFGITVRLHWTLLLFGYYRINQYAAYFGSFGFGVAMVVGLYVCILLHEFGHALMAIWCDGEVDQIVLWPLGGLAVCRPAWNATAHLLTTVAGPCVTLVLWLAFAGLSRLILLEMPDVGLAPVVYRFCREMSLWNLVILLFNLIPAFPMDGGRILRDTLWHFISATTATLIAVRVSQLIASAALVYAIYQSDVMLLAVAAFILLQASASRHLVGFEAAGEYQFSIRERLHRGRRRRQFFNAVAETKGTATDTPWHQCAVCGKTDRAYPAMDFRVCTDCGNSQEYCPDHLATHTHR